MEIFITFRMLAALLKLSVGNSHFRAISPMKFWKGWRVCKLILLHTWLCNVWNLCKIVLNLIYLSLLIEPSFITDVGDRKQLLHKIARTMPFWKIEKMINSYIFCKSTGLEKFTGANCDQIGPLVETLSSLIKVGTRLENRLSIWCYIGAVSHRRYIVNKNSNSTVYAK